MLEMEKTGVAGQKEGAALQEPMQKQCHYVAFTVHPFFMNVS